MERLQSSEAVIVEAVAHASEMDMFEIGGQITPETREAMVVTSEVGKTMVVTSETDDNTMVVTGDTMVVTGETDNTMVVTGNTMVVTDETDDNAMVVTGNTMVVTDETDDNAMVVTGNTMVVTGETDDNTMVVTGNTMVVTGDTDDNTMVVTDETDDSTMIVTGEHRNPMVVTDSSDPKVVTGEPVDTAIMARETGGTLIVTTGEGWDTMVVTSYKMTSTDVMDVPKLPMQVADGSTVATGEQVDGNLHQEASISRPLLEALDLTLQGPDTGRVIDGDQVQMDNSNEGNGSMKSAQDLSKIEQQTECADKMPSYIVQPQNDATEDEEADEIMFVCVHGQTFRCKPQAGMPVKSIKEPSPAVDACACSKSKKPTNDGVEAVQSSELRNWKQKFICDKCGGRFTQQASLDRHMFSHEDENEKGESETDKTNQKFGATQRRTRQQQKQLIEAMSLPNKSCPDCGKLFLRLKALELHRKQHEKKTHKKTEDGQKSDKTDKGCRTKKEFKCRVCEKVLESRYKLHRHEEEHLPPEQIENLTCKECSKVFTRLFNLQRHEKSHREKKQKPPVELKNMSCKVCFKVFTRPLHLLRHEKLHIKEKGKLLNCAFCSETFEDKFSYILHNKTHTVKNYYRDMQCEVCQRVVKGPITLKRHMRTHTKEKPYPCRNGCNTSFSSTSYRLSHERMHCKNGQSYLCTTCGEIFANKSKLINHETKIHRGGLDEQGNVPRRSQLPCRFCGRIFRASAVRKRHERIHTNEKPYMCRYCPKSFVHDNALQCHERVHTKERPYKCAVCSKAFSQTGHLRTHMRVHTKEKPYKCRICKQAFSHLGSRKNHEKKHKDNLESELLADAPREITHGTQENLQEPVLQEDGPNSNPEMTYENFQESGLQQDVPHELPEMTCEDIQMEEDMTDKIVLSHPEHDMQTAVILQLLESGNRSQILLVHA